MTWLESNPCIFIANLSKRTVLYGQKIVAQRSVLPLVPLCGGVWYLLGAESQLPPFVETINKNLTAFQR
ncbi:hypothetical protein M433DRAFT_150043 [Acidomyces richmondensis BFW]|nr:MAG: hypothetical protein FE78DRAFT_88375 [Acidomyces sp. 'richmondensis']KYG49372.1 hypothetical protein M433DRAFT_150043 [Acidomyces richmondensis BFW]